jgi:hypothetical protein
MMGWTLPYQFGIKVYAANTPFETAMNPEREVLPANGEILGEARGTYLISHETNTSFTATNRVLQKGGKVFWAKKSFSIGGQTYPEGTVIIPAANVDGALIKNLAKDLRLKITAAGEAPKVETYALKKPRIGIYQSWIPSEDEGWTRYVLDQYEFPFTTLHDADIKAGGLAGSYDVIIIPDHWTSELVINGFPKGMMPPAYVGGITADGLRNLKLFAEDGGGLVFINSMCDLAAENFGLPVRNVLKGVKREDFVCTGSLLRMEFDTTHPLAYGMPKEAPAVFLGSRAFEILPSFEAKKEPQSAAHYAAENLLMSGYIYGEKLIQQKSAVLDIPLGNGKVILLGFAVQFRGQPQGTFKLLLNALYYGAAK